MLTIFDQPRNCSRRDFLRIGSLGMSGLTLSDLLRVRTAAAETQNTLTDKSVIFIFMHGGPSQLDTFDPKPTAPEGVRSIFGAIPTRLPGVAFGSNFPRLAQLADKLAVVRTFVPGDANHGAKPLVHPETLDANIGSLYARVAGLIHPTTGLPSNILLYPQSIDPNANILFGGHGNFEATGSVGKAYAPFVPGGTGDLQKNLRLRIASDRLDDRRALLAQLDSLNREVDNSGTMEALDRFQAQAFDVLRCGVADAFNLSKEDPQTIARYDTSPLANVATLRSMLANIDPKAQAAIFLRYMIDHGRTLGKQLLLARRLCEQGCGFVTVNTNFVWDMHGSARAPSVQDAMPIVGPVFDHAVAALIEDLEARGLRDKVMVVCCGEMGRTPRIQPDGGRDHWANLGPLLLYGGGLKMGQVVGKSTRNAADPDAEPVTIKNLVATISQTLFNVGELRLTRGISGDLAKVLTEGDPIAPLMP